MNLVDRALFMAAAKTAAVVGSLLVLINFRGEIFSSNIFSLDIFRVCVTALTPFLVSVWSRISVRKQHLKATDSNYHWFGNAIRALFICLIAGSFLNWMNYSDQVILLVTESQALTHSYEMAITYMIPFLVSNYGRAMEWKSIKSSTYLANASVQTA